MNPIGTAPAVFEPTEAFARRLDEADALAVYRARFHMPRGSGGRSPIYFAGNSLGLQPRSTRAAVEQELDDWAQLAVDAHLSLLSAHPTGHFGAIS